MAGIPLRPSGAALSRTKRLIDVVLAAGGLILVAPVLVMIALAIVVESGWPPVYVQARAGLVGRPFRMWKFRTMVKNADDLKASLLSQNEAAYPAFKIRNDPRVTKVGRFLRRSSLDELPQLWNVLVGEMSLVGPRPLPVEESARLNANHLARLQVRPGITCLWQIGDRHARSSEFESWAALDLQYIDDWSIRLDLSVLLKTIPAVLRMSGN